MGNLMEGYQLGSTSLYDRSLKQQQLESALMNDQVSRKVAEEGLVLRQQAAAASVQSRKDAQDRAKRLEALMVQQPTTGLEQGIPTAPQQAPAGISPEGVPSAAPQPDGAAAALGVAPGAPSGPAATGASPLIAWMRKNPAVGTQLVDAIATGDGEAQRKLLAMYHESEKGTKRVEDTGNVKDYSFARNNGYNGTFTDFLKLKQAQTNVNIDTKREGKFAEVVGGDAAGRRNTYLEEGTAAAKNIRDYKGMYANILEVSDTGALADARLGIRKLAMATGIGEEVAQAMTNIEADDVAGWETLRSQTMNRVFERIAATKGAISEREMEAFTNSVAGVRNTRRGNILILEGQIDELERTKEKASYIRKHAPQTGGSERLELAERGWIAQQELREDARADTWTARASLIRKTPDGAIGYLAKNRSKPKVRAAFKKKYGWIPKGMK